MELGEVLTKLLSFEPLVVDCVVAWLVRLLVVTLSDSVCREHVPGDEEVKLLENWRSSDEMGSEKRLSIYSVGAGSDETA